MYLAFQLGTTVYLVSSQKNQGPRVKPRCITSNSIKNYEILFSEAEYFSDKAVIHQRAIGAFMNNLKGAETTEIGIGIGRF